MSKWICGMPIFVVGIFCVILGGFVLRHCYQIGKSRFPPNPTSSDIDRAWETKLSDGGSTTIAEAATISLVALVFGASVLVAFAVVAFMVK